MIRSKKIDCICLCAILLAAGIAVLFANSGKLGVKPMSASPGYETRLFDQSYVHKIDIEIEDWEKFLENAKSESYQECSLTIDGEKFSDVAIRAKGNNSLSLTEKYDLDRYSLKIEFDHYASNHYYGLDKFSLDSSFQDNSYLKSFLTFDMMKHMEVPAPLCSYVWVTVNGEDWGLFLAIEEIEEAFAKRNYGNQYGKLYKPDYKNLEDPNEDVALKYIDDNPQSYDNIFRNAKFDITPEDQKRLIQCLKILDTGENLEEAVEVEEVLRYFVVQVFVVNMDSYLGRTGHNYFLYEEEGKISILPWDYNLAYGTYSLGMPNPINDSTLYINYPINTPASGEIMLNRPLYHHLMLNDSYFRLYHQYFDWFIENYFLNGYFETKVSESYRMISPYVKKDPTAFCSFKDYVKAVETIREFCLLRAESVKKQLNGEIPATIAGQDRDRSGFVDGASVWLPDMGEIEDLKNGGGKIEHDFTE